jgi:hypothetical protein
METYQPQFVLFGIGQDLPSSKFHSTYHASERSSKAFIYKDMS